MSSPYTYLDIACLSPQRCGFLWNVEIWERRGPPPIHSELGAVNSLLSAPISFFGTEEIRTCADFCFALT